MELLIDGVRYKLWTPKDEAALEDIVKEHVKDIFGEDSIPFGIKPKIKSKAGIGSIPDGYVITFEGTPRWCVVEVELSSHALYDHIVPQMTKFSTGINDLSTQRAIVDTFYGEINSDIIKQTLVKNKIGSREIHEFLSGLISSPPILVIVIEEKTKELEEVCSSLPLKTQIREFKTFAREGIGLAVHAHLFEPLWKPVLVELPVAKVPEGEPPYTGERVEIHLSSLHTPKRYHLIPLPKKYRPFFPGYKIDFILETDIGGITTRVTSRSGPAQVGDPNAGNYIQRGLRPWYDKHPELKSGDRLIIEAIEPKKRYRLKMG